MSLNNCVFEGSGLDFGDPGARFWRARARFFKGFGCLKRWLKAFLGGEHFATDLSCIIGPFAGEKWSRSRRATGHLPRMPVLPCPGSDGRGARGVGGRRCSPAGGFQSAAHRRCAGRARLQNAMYAKLNKILALSSASKF